MNARREELISLGESPERDRSPEFRVAAAAKLAVIRAVEKFDRLPDVSEIAEAIADVLRRELFEARLAGELATSRQYCHVLEHLMPARR